MRERLSLTTVSRRWTAAGIVLMTTAATALTLLHSIDHDVGWLAAATTIVLMTGFPAVSGVYVRRFRRDGEDLAADALLACTLAAVVSIFLIWGIWGGGAISL